MHISIHLKLDRYLRSKAKRALQRTDQHTRETLKTENQHWCSVRRGSRLAKKHKPSTKATFFFMAAAQPSQAVADLSCFAGRCHFETTLSSSDICLKATHGNMVVFCFLVSSIEVLTANPLYGFTFGVTRTRTCCEMEKASRGLHKSSGTRQHRLQQQLPDACWRPSSRWRCSVGNEWRCG